MDLNGPELKRPLDGDGVIKFQLRWTKGDYVSEEMVQELRTVRKVLFQKGLIGVDHDGIGFGNISRRCFIPTNIQQDRMQQEGFLISGSQTGHFVDPGPDGYAYVPEWSIPGNWVRCVGLAKASSESLTHAAIYEYSSQIQAVIHVHSASLWGAWKNENAQTRMDVQYGTPAMAIETRRVMRTLEKGVRKGILRMSGHLDGIVAWGTSLQEAVALILEQSEAKVL